MTPKMLLLLVSTCTAAPFSNLDKRKIPHDNAVIKDYVQEDDSIGLHIHEDKQIDKKVKEDHQFELNVHDDKKAEKNVEEDHPIGLHVHEDLEVDDIMEHAQDGLQVQGDNQINELKVNKSFKRDGKFWDDFAAVPCTGMGSGWSHVRHVPSGYTWHPATDQLMGTDVYGDPNNMNEAWSVKFDQNDFNQFLFSTGDCSKWLITGKGDVLGDFYSDQDRQVKRSSTSSTPYTAKWYRRKGAREDPWISLTDHAGAISQDELLYGGNSFGGAHAGVLKKHNGADVFIRHWVSTLPIHWKSYAYTLMCNHPGSDSEKASKVNDEMSSDYPEHNWVVAISHEDLESTYSNKGGTYEMWRNTCGKDMYVWTKPDSKFEKTSCTSTEEEQVASIIHLAELTGTSAATIRDTIKSNLKVFGIPYHLVIVTQKSASVKIYVYRKCFIRHTGDKYDIIVYRA